MTKLKIKRRRIILDLIVKHGFEVNGEYFMSFWDLAHVINSTWEAENFINTKKVKSEYLDRYAIPGWALPKLFPAIRHALRDMDYPLVAASGVNQVEFVVYKI